MLEWISLNGWEKWKKEEWEEKPSGMTFTHRSQGSHQRESPVEMQEEAALDLEDLMLEQAIEFLKGTFSNLKACKALAQMMQLTTQPVQVPVSDGVLHPLPRLRRNPLLWHSHHHNQWWAQ